MILRALAIVVLAAVAMACRTTASAFPMGAARDAEVVAVLAPEGTLPQEGRAILRRLVGAYILERQYSKLDDEFVDARLTAAGLNPGSNNWLPGDEKLASIGKAMGADALIVLSGFEDEHVSAAVLYRRGLGGSVRWIDTKSGRAVWRTEVSDSKTGGLALESGQLIKAVGNVADSAAQSGFVRLAASIAQDLTSAIPKNPNPTGVRPRPALESFDVTQTKTLMPGVEWIAEAKGTPGGRVLVGISGLPGEFPLVEVSPGVYRGRYRVEPGWGDGDGPFRAILYDPFGDTSEVKKTSDRFSVRARRPDGQGGPPTVTQAP